MELPLKLKLKNYRVRRYPDADAGAMLTVKKGVKGELDYSLEYDGFIIEFNRKLALSDKTAKISITF